MSRSAQSASEARHRLAIQNNDRSARLANCEKQPNEESLSALIETEDFFGTGKNGLYTNARGLITAALANEDQKVNPLNT